jgi:putative ATP-dependent endonuclease of OLD family
MTVEHFRGIRHLDLHLDDMTVLIAENNHGKTSVFDVLGLCLGPRGADPETLFREEDFYRAPDGSTGDIRIVLTFAPEDDGEGSQGSLRVEFSGHHRDRRLVRRFVNEDGSPREPQPDAAALDALQERHPILLLRFAQPQHEWRREPEPGYAAGGDERRGRQNLAATVARVYQDLAHTRAPLPAEEITKGLDAARSLLDGDDDGQAPVHRMLEELRDEVRKWSRPQSADSMLGLSGSGSHNLALLLVLGSLLDVRGEKALPADAHPIIAIEEPEAHLHPILLASTWDVIEALHAQTIVTTNSGELLSSVPMTKLRRLEKSGGRITAHRLGERTLSASDLRRVAYHIRARRGGVLFARCWLLVEGESEFWLMSRLAEVLGYDLEAEGVRSVEFAQCGVAPLVKLANDLGIAWHLLSDGDESGQAYVRDARKYVPEHLAERHISQLVHRDVEQCLWHEGFEDIYRNAARIAPRPDGGGPPPGRIIGKAVRRKSKPHLALAVGEAAAERGRRSIPAVLRSVIEHSVALAREASEAGSSG